MELLNRLIGAKRPPVRRSWEDLMMLRPGFAECVRISESSPLLVEVIGKQGSTRTADKKFELDHVGEFLVRKFDGQTTVESLGQDLVTTFGMHEVEARESLIQFLMMLDQRGILSFGSTS